MFEMFYVTTDVKSQYMLFPICSTRNNPQKRILLHGAVKQNWNLILLINQWYVSRRKNEAYTEKNSLPREKHGGASVVPLSMRNEIRSLRNAGRSWRLAMHHVYMSYKQKVALLSTKDP